MKVRAFITHKKAETFRDCQDRFSVNPDTKSIAVSDGMSQSIFQKIWAEMLVKKYTDFGDWVPNIESIKELSPEWLRKVEEFIKIEEENGNNPWRAKNSIYAEHRSAGATILGIRFIKQEWTCEVLGDSCLIVVESNKVRDIISSSDSSTFDNYPDYYDSDSNKPGKGKLNDNAKGELSDANSLLLVSDPFSDFLSRHRDDEELIKQIFAIKNHQEFETFVEKWRDEGMHNDDSTLVIVEYDGKDEFNLGEIDDIANLIKVESKNEKNELNEDDNKSEKNSDESEKAIKDINTGSEHVNPLRYKVRKLLCKKFINKKLPKKTSEKEKYINDTADEVMKLFSKEN